MKRSNLVLITDMYYDLCRPTSRNITQNLLKTSTVNIFSGHSAKRKRWHFVGVGREDAKWNFSGQRWYSMSTRLNLNGFDVGYF